MPTPGSPHSQPFIYSSHNAANWQTGRTIKNAFICIREYSVFGLASLGEHRACNPKSLKMAKQRFVHINYLVFIFKEKKNSKPFRAYIILFFSQALARIVDAVSAALTLMCSFFVEIHFNFFARSFAAFIWDGMVPCDESSASRTRRTNEIIRFNENHIFLLPHFITC